MHWTNRRMPWLSIGIETKVVTAMILLERAKKRALIAVMKILKIEGVK